MTIWGCQAGKDVYVEKPCSHNVHEGRVAVEAARKYNRIVQHGTQSRSRCELGRSMAEIVKSGQLRQAAGLPRALLQADPQTRSDIGFKPTPKPRRPNSTSTSGSARPRSSRINANYVHYNWHWFWDFGNGDIGNQGVHQMDIARWMIPGATLPKTVLSLGGRFGYKDQGQTPNTQIAVMDFGDTQLIFEVRGLEQAVHRHQGERRSATSSISKTARSPGIKFTPKGRNQGEPLPKVDGRHARTRQGATSATSSPPSAAARPAT